MSVPKCYQFLEGGGKKILCGKARWPNQLTLTVDRFTALDMLQRLSSGLQDPNREEISLYLLGEMVEHPDK